MRKLLSGLGVMLLAGGLSAVAGVSPAQAQCPMGDGTIPGSSASTLVIGEQTLDPNAHSQYQTLFVDDRDFLDLDEDTIAGGLWVYIESGLEAGLQSGGDHLVFTLHPALNPNIPLIGPFPILGPNPGGLPVFPSGLTLFPDGFGGGSLSEAAGFHDDCNDRDNPPDGPDGNYDHILF